MNAMKNRKRCFAIAGISLLVIAAVFIITKSSSPNGRYVVSSSLAHGEDVYWEFANGKVAFVSCDSTGTYRDEHGLYFKKPEGWFWSNDTNRNNPAAIKVECSWVGLHVTATNGYHEFWRRRFIPGYRPDWMVRSLPWCIQ
jgi:hypothetical protein